VIHASRNVVQRRSLSLLLRKPRNISLEMRCLAEFYRTSRNLPMKEDILGEKSSTLREQRNSRI